MKFEDDGKKPSYDGLNSSQDDLVHIWPNDDDSDRIILRRQGQVLLPHSRAHVVS